MEKIALCPGTYDPLTEGHKDVITRSSRVFPSVVVAITKNTNKEALYSVARRVDFAKRSLAKIKNIRIISFEGLLVDLALKEKVNVIIKGLRAISDFEYEFQMAQINKKLCKGIETMFLVTDPRYAYLSSSAVKEVARFGGSIKGLVPEEIEPDIVESFAKNIFD